MNWSLWLKASPYHDFAIMMLSTRLPDFRSTRSMVWVLCPLLVTASHFLLWLMVIFNGRSPNRILLPTGVNDHPLGSFTLFFSKSASVCADEMTKDSRQPVNKRSSWCFFMCGQSSSLQIVITLKHWINNINLTGSWELSIFFFHTNYKTTTENSYCKQVLAFGYLYLVSN